MNYDVVLSLEAVEDVLRITMASDSKTAVVNASKQLRGAVRSGPCVRLLALPARFCPWKDSYLVDSDT